MRETADILKTSKSIKLLVNMKNVSFILQRKPRGLFGQPNTFKKSNRSVASPPTSPAILPLRLVLRLSSGQAADLKELRADKLG